MGRKAIDLTGQRFGKLVVLEKTGNRDANGGIIWKLICDCGNQAESTPGKLNAGYKLSCGCLKEKDLTGLRFGNFTVLEKSKKKHSTRGRQWWSCVCDCGNTRDVNTNSLTSGNSTSCGCSRIRDLKGKKFGKLTVIEFSGKKSKSGLLWECKCDCGEVVKVASSSLLKANTRSCGCIAREYIESMKGENHPGYNHTLKKEDRMNRRSCYRKDGNYISWVKEVYARDGFYCQSCNQRGYILNAHHLNGWNAFPEQRFDTANGITLCEDCHKEFHHFNGYGDNTLEEFRDHIACTVGEEHVSEIEESLLSRESEIIGQEQSTRELQTI